MDEKRSVFRKKSIARISSPEQLNDYICVSSPSVWLILLSVAVLLAGVIIWGVFGTMNSYLDVCAVSENGVTTCYIKGERCRQSRGGYAGIRGGRAARSPRLTGRP